MSNWKIFSSLIPLFGSFCSLYAGESVSAVNQNGSSSSTGESEVRRPATYQAAFEIKTFNPDGGSGKIVKESCAVCHNLQVKIDGRLYNDGEVATLRKGVGYSITVKDTPSPPPGAATNSAPPHDNTQKFTIWPKALAGESIELIDGGGGETKGFIVTKNQFVQYLIDNNEKLLVQNKDWPTSAADEPMNKKAILGSVIMITPAGDPVKAPVPAIPGFPDVPDGANEFTYSRAEPGVLTLRLKAKVPGISNLGQAVQNRFKFEVDAVGNSTLTWQQGNEGGKVTVDGDYIKAQLTFTGLPQHNSDFGLKKARVTFDGKKVDESAFEVFFPKTAKNHPGGDTSVDRPPNWFYYWKQGGVCGIPSNCRYDDSSSLYGYYRPSDGAITLCKVAAEKNGGPHEWVSKVDASNKLTTTAEGKGIQCVAETIKHELHHKTIHHYFGYDWPSGGDGDGIDDGEESTYDGINTSPGEPDTFNIHLRNGYADYAATGDQEVRCLAIERRAPAITVYPKKDWANPGSQSALQYGPLP